MEPENGEDILFGTCNIVAIIGSCFFIASESRLTKKDELTISSDDYNKIWKLDDTLYLTMTGSKSVVEEMKIDTKNYLDRCEKLKSFPVFKDKIAGDNKRPDFTENQLRHWMLKYQNAASFFCSFVDQKPVIYRVCAKNENNAPIDVSTLAENAGFDFLGSSIKQARKYLVETEFFRRCEEFEKDGNVSVGDIFVQFAKNYFARAIVSCALVDKFCGGDIQVKCISASGECLSFTSNVAQVYLDSYGDLEMHKDKVLLLFVSIESKDGADAVLKLTPMFKKWGTLAFFHRLGVFRKAYIHRIVFAKSEVDINSLADHTKDKFNSKTGKIGPKRVGCFGFPAIEYEGLRVSGLFPGSDGVPIKELLCSNNVAR
ncbi:hypothetical protein D8674_004413 [Pyrus ussuriensis x Pyrus communis]|uniref:Uncharacterized protein n=1 Tax=Pyrus ussuriensis x Pyrus communis TaxID=2448454 RepID=A0A5N5FJT5_9ROSA|nr:hypothetical protein D8674_004413 [Pyrus ussuriensis x Pyrus communis]